MFFLWQDEAIKWNACSFYKGLYSLTFNLSNLSIGYFLIQEDLQSVIVPYTQRPHTHDKTGQQRKRKKSGNTKPSKQGTQVVQLQERLQTAEEVKTMYVKHNRDLTEKLVKEKKTSEKAECERQNVLLRYEILK